jgi:hypothetical protein
MSVPAVARHLVATKDGLIRLSRLVSLWKQ